jgi:hypothetical protein
MATTVRRTIASKDADVAAALPEALWAVRTGRSAAVGFRDRTTKNAHHLVVPDGRGGLLARANGAPDRPIDLARSGSPGGVPQIAFLGDGTPAPLKDGLLVVDAPVGPELPTRSGSAIWRNELNRGNDLVVTLSNGQNLFIWKPGRESTYEIQVDHDNPVGMERFGVLNDGRFAAFDKDGNEVWPSAIGTTVTNIRATPAVGHSMQLWTRNGPSPIQGVFSGIGNVAGGLVAGRLDWDSAPHLPASVVAQAQPVSPFQPAQLQSAPIAGVRGGVAVVPQAASGLASVQQPGAPAVGVAGLNSVAPAPRPVAPAPEPTSGPVAKGAQVFDVRSSRIRVAEIEVPGKAMYFIRRDPRDPNVAELTRSQGRGQPETPVCKVDVRTLVGSVDSQGKPSLTFNEPGSSRPKQIGGGPGGVGDVAVLDRNNRNVELPGQGLTSL